MEDSDKKQALPVHLILGASDYAKIKTIEAQRVGEMGQPIAEKNKFGWAVMSPGKEPNIDKSNFAHSSNGDYEMLCRLDVLGLQDTPTGDQSIVHSEFLEELQCSSEGCFEAALPWKGNHPPLPNNRAWSLKRF